MKIAFVGKGGSGKTTLTSFFTKYLLKNNKKVILIDADINVGLADSMGIKLENKNYISKENIAKDIKKFLIGKNNKIKNENYFVKTTPPAFGSNIISFENKDFFNKFSNFKNENLNFLYVGTYEKESIGVSCYHTNLSVLENIISHSITKKDEFIIVDMVAGNDSFSNTLHSQFDAIFLIIEATKESVEMSKKFLELSKEETTSPIFIIANKIEDKDDLIYLKENNINPFFTFSYDKNIKKQRRNGEIKLDDKKDDEMKLFLEKIEKNITKNPKKRLKDLHILHKKYIKLDYIKNPLGDLKGQIDLNFNFDNEINSK